MKSSSKHSFVILAYQQSPYIEECIDSLKNQTVKSEIIIITSTPSQFLRNLAKKHDVPLFLNNGTSGIAADWTFAYNCTKTDYVTLAHQDDIYMPGYSEACLKSAVSHKNSLIVFTDYIELVNRKTRDNNLLLNVKRLILLIFYTFRENLSSYTFKKMLFLLGNPICCPTILYNRKNIGNFVFDNSFSMNLDWAASLKLVGMKGDFVYVKKKLLIRRIHGESESTNALKNNIRQEEDQRLFEQFWPKPVVKIILKLYSLAYRSNG
ncbi:MAG: glycosyltransferase family 2 protein [Desulfobacteraceae bacterium]|nr:MAG: glycosyltransferase family 2 protein [Desulfobacteraceae bacterium]